MFLEVIIWSYICDTYQLRIKFIASFLCFSRLLLFLFIFLKKNNTEISFFFVWRCVYVNEIIMNYHHGDQVEKIEFISRKARGRVFHHSFKMCQGNSLSFFFTLLFSHCLFSDSACHKYFRSYFGSFTHINFILFLINLLSFMLNVLFFVYKYFFFSVYISSN